MTGAQGDWSASVPLAFSFTQQQPGRLRSNLQSPGSDASRGWPWAFSLTLSGGGGGGGGGSAFAARTVLPNKKDGPRSRPHVLLGPSGKCSGMTLVAKEASVHLPALVRAAGHNSHQTLRNHVSRLARCSSNESTLSFRLRDIHSSTGPVAKCSVQADLYCESLLANAGLS